jgi:hypothetical protein
MSNDGIRRNMEKIATFVENFPVTKQNDFETWMSSLETPADAMIHAAKQLVAAHQAAVMDALPHIYTHDFAEAARQIRERAAALP